MRSREQVASLPFWMLCMGAVTSVGSAILAVRLIWEQTALSWRYGPQMVGFSLAHGRGIILLCFPIGLVAWLLLIAAMTAISVARKQPVSPWRGASGVAGLALLGLLSLPYGTWQRVFA